MAGKIEFVYGVPQSRAFAISLTHCSTKHTDVIMCIKKRKNPNKMENINMQKIYGMYLIKCTIKITYITNVHKLKAWM